MNPSDFAAASSSDEEELKKVLGPPADAQKKLDNLVQDADVIIQQFHDLWTQPYFDQLSCSDPTHSNKLTTISLMISHYREEHQYLRVETIPIIEDLMMYSELQTGLLPMLSIGNNTHPGQLKMQEFLDTNKLLIPERLKRATDISHKAIEAKNAWNNAVDLAQKSINECDKQIDSLKETFKGLSERQKGATLHSALGAVAPFTATAFHPESGILAAVGANSSLGKLTITEILKLGKEDEVETHCKSGIQKAKNAVAKLSQSVAFMEKFQESLSSISSIWSDITATTTSLNSFYEILADPASKALSDKVRSEVIGEWTTVSVTAKKVHLV